MPGIAPVVAIGAIIGDVIKIGGKGSGEFLIDGGRDLKNVNMMMEEYMYEHGYDHYYEDDICNMAD